MEYQQLWNELKGYLQQGVVCLQSESEINEHLNGKIEGMKLALSKIDELERLAGDDINCMADFR